MPVASPQLNLVVLRSSNIERTARFYTGLGLHFTRHAHGSGPEHYASSACGMVFEIYPVTEKSGTTTGVRIGFIVDSVDELLPRLVGLGATVFAPPTDSMWGRRVVIKDLDGHTVELVTPQRRNSS